MDLLFVLLTGKIKKKHLHSSIQLCFEKQILKNQNHLKILVKQFLANNLGNLGTGTFKDSFWRVSRIKCIVGN